MNKLKHIAKSGIYLLKYFQIYVRGLLLHSDERSVFISVSGGGAGSAADLRGISLAKELPKFGWRAVLLPANFSKWQRRSLWRVYRPCVVVLQQTRNIHNTPHLYPGTPCILDADDADILDEGNRKRIGRIAAECRSVIAGSRFLAGLFKKYNPDVAVIWTGTYLTEVPEAKSNHLRSTIVSWAPSDPFGYPEEREFVTQVARALGSITPFTLRIYGIKKEEFSNAHQMFAEQLPASVRLELRPPMLYANFVKSLTEVAIGLQPICESNAYSMGKSFGKVLGYLAADVAVIASDNIDHPLFFQSGQNGILLPNTAEQWANACAQLIQSPDQRSKLVQNARQSFLSRLTTRKSAELLDKILNRAVIEATVPTT